MKTFMRGYGTIAALIWLAFIGLMGYGWVSNIIDLIRNVGEGIGLIIARAAGIFIVPLGVLLGYFA